MSIDSNSQTFSNLPQTTWACWVLDLVPLLQNNGCDQIVFTGGNTGTLSFHHSVPFSDGDFAFNYAYDPGAQALTLVITDSPNVLSNSLIFSKIQGAIYTCPPAST